ncbi:hypothetical protein [Ferroacidibacillus organovorans]|uniref:Uncharacterized protein n=1 Tax=Ferroacidibacillus organovorans TaxID=1765683 RepID=A0A101XNA5_9BACL|nr:hypothetical protein [Ferroacidibacillus organovorans]KUO94590.1 hypothetical protein ATW55_04145 [Ferroacidibacillus organovorans]
MKEWVKRFMDLASPQQKVEDKQEATQTVEPEQGNLSGVVEQGGHPPFSPFTMQEGAQTIEGASPQRLPTRTPAANSVSGSTSLPDMIRKRLQGILPKKMTTPLGKGDAGARGLRGRSTRGPFGAGGAYPQQLNSQQHIPQQGMWPTGAGIPQRVNTMANRGMSGAQTPQMPPSQLRIPALRGADRFVPFAGIERMGTPHRRFSMLKRSGLQSSVANPMRRITGGGAQPMSRVGGSPRGWQTSSYIDPYTGQPRGPRPPMPPGFF